MSLIKQLRDEHHDSYLLAQGFHTIRVNKIVGWFIFCKQKKKWTLKSLNLKK